MGEALGGVRGQVIHVVEPTPAEEIVDERGVLQIAVEELDAGGHVVEIAAREIVYDGDGHPRVGAGLRDP